MRTTRPGSVPTLRLPGTAPKPNTAETGQRDSAKRCRVVCTVRVPNQRLCNRWANPAAIHEWQRPVSCRFPRFELELEFETAKVGTAGLLPSTWTWFQETHFSCVSAVEADRPNWALVL